MLLSEIFDYLNYGELAPLAIGNETEGGIPTESFPKVVSHLNLGLLALYTEFPLRHNSVVVQMRSDVTKYILKPQYSVNNISEPITYILDTVTEPFVGRVLKINKVVSSDEEECLLLNDSNDSNTTENTVRTIAHNVLQVSNPDPSHTLTVYYREGPEKIDPVGLDPTTTEIELSETLIEPLLYYIAARAHARTPALEGQQSISSLYMQKYDRALSILKENGVIENHPIINDSLTRNGWV